MSVATQTAAPRRTRALIVAGLMAVAVVASGCAGLNSTEQRTLSGGAAGAAIGAAGTAVTGGCVACGAALGGAVGAGAGFISDQLNDNDGD